MIHIKGDQESECTNQNVVGARHPSRDFRMIFPLLLCGFQILLARQEQEVSLDE